MRRGVMFVALVLFPLTVAACGGQADTANPDDAAPVVRQALAAFVDGFNLGDVSGITEYLAPADDQYGTTETLDAAANALTSFPAGSEMSLASFDVTDAVGDESTNEVVVSYTAALEVTDATGRASVIDVNQDVAVQWIDGRWLVTGADPADVTVD